MDPSDPRYDRLLLNKERIEAIAKDVETVMNLPSPLHHILEERRLPNGLLLQRISVPLGVVAVIYESRPNVTVDVFSLCFKAGNGCVVKGGKEASHSNQALSACIHEALKKEGVSPEVFYALPSERASTSLLLNAIHLVDVCIPRGSQSLINAVRKEAKIPIIETGAGIVHTYFDKEGDFKKGQNIIFNAKTRRVSVCNALDTLIIHSARLKELSELVKPLQEKSVLLWADKRSYDVLCSHYDASYLKQATPEVFGREFLSHQLAIKTVDSLEEAVEHIQQYTSGHSEAIVTESKRAADFFINHVDAAVVYVNASTAFTDGAQFGLGAEIGISTQKLHARGPMALDALTSYQWVIHGDGQIRPA